MKYSEAVNFLFSLRRYEFSQQTDSTLELLDRLGNPQESLDSILITGSNGKGSTAKLTAGIFDAADLNVGLFVSPHLEDVRESVRVNDRCISKESFVEYVETVRPIIETLASEGAPPTMFEALTPLAIWEFERRGVDVAVLEVGVGGDGDATTVVDPVASAVTTVSLEHTQVLGETVEEIARTKASIAPDDGPLVTGAAGDALSAIREVADDVVTVSTDGDTSVRGTESVDGRSNVTIRGDDWSVETTISLPGPHQEQNAAIAATLARSFAEIDESDIARGLGTTDWEGRCEIMQRDPLVIVDGAHNEDACSKLASTLDSLSYESLYLVFGSAAVKDQERFHLSVIS